jgi:hypothetical protein
MFVRMLLSVDIALMLEDLLYSNARPSSCSSCETSLWCKRARSAHEGVLAVVLEHGSSVWRKRQDTDLNSELRQTHVEQSQQCETTALALQATTCLSAVRSL